jgi:hypothetical protein
MRPVVGIGVDVEGDAALTQQPPRALGRRHPPFPAEGHETIDEPAPMRPHRAVRRQHLIEARGGHAVAGQQAVEFGRFVGRVGQSVDQHAGADRPIHRALRGCRKVRRKSMV